MKGVKKYLELSHNEYTTCQNSQDTVKEYLDKEVQLLKNFARKQTNKKPKNLTYEVRKRAIEKSEQGGRHKEDRAEIKKKERKDY